MEKFTEKEIKKSLTQLRGWQFNGNSIVKTFSFNNFKETFAAMTQIAFEAEAQNHHPDWKNVYNQLEIQLNTHDAGGVTEKDIKLAKTIDALLN